MTTPKDRDRIWDRVLDLIQSSEPFSIVDVREGLGQVSTDSEHIRETLKSMEELGWVTQTEDGNRWEPNRVVIPMSPPGMDPPFLRKLSRQNVKHPSEFDNLPVESCLNALSEGDVLDVAFPRYSSGTGHLIAYPITCDFENTEDGIHVDPPETINDRIQQYITDDNALVAGRIQIDEITTQYPLAEVVDIISGKFLTDNKVAFTVGTAVSNLQIEESGIVRDAFSYHFADVETVANGTEQGRSYQDRRRDILKEISSTWR